MPGANLRGGGGEGDLIGMTLGEAADGVDLLDGPANGGGAESASSRGVRTSVAPVSCTGADGGGKAPSSSKAERIIVGGGSGAGVDNGAQHFQHTDRSA